MQEFVIPAQENALVILEDMDKIVQVSNHGRIKHYSMLFSMSYFISLEFDCPADGLCSNQGTCDDSIGNCICDPGFEGITCQGKLLKDFH